MKSYLHFSVAGQPPKKDAANSMWRKPEEMALLKTLRRAALEAMDGRDPLAEALEIRILIFAERNAGDLDDFVAGIFSGLQSAHSRTPIQLSDWVDLPVGALPSENIVFTNDTWVDRLTAERLPPDETGPRYYIEVFRF